MWRIYVTPRRKLYSFWIDPETAERLKRVKARTGLTESQQIRSAVSEWLDRAERPRTRKATRKEVTARRRRS